LPILSGRALEERLTTRQPNRRLVVSPLLEPEEQLSPDQASIDVRLGCDFRLVHAARVGVLDEFADDPDNAFKELERLYEHFYVPLGEAVVVHPHQLFLAITLEYLRLPADLAAYVVGRSTFGRLGLIIATAVGIHPRFFGSLTLEIRNLGETPIRLYPGQAVAQLFFHDVGGVSSPRATSERTAQYSGTTDPVPRKISRGNTSQILRQLRKSRRSIAEATSSK
jgi:dCTP deaminase